MERLPKEPAIGWSRLAVAFFARCQARSTSSIVHVASQETGHVASLLFPDQR